jgi:hypothetical protein
VAHGTECFMSIVANEPIMLSVIKLNVIVLNVVMLNVVNQNVVMLSVKALHKWLTMTNTLA